MEIKMEDRTFSIFKVYDYKGGELRTEVNKSFNYVVGEIIEAGMIEHKELPYSDSIYEILENLPKDEALIKCNALINESTLRNDIYAGGDCGPIMKIFEHVDNRLVQASLNEFKPYLAENIMKDI